MGAAFFDFDDEVSPLCLDEAAAATADDGFLGLVWAATTTLCGSTSSFSPFAMFASAAPFVQGIAFFQPLSPIPSFVNTPKAGSTVPLKFNVYVNGQEKTDTQGWDSASRPSPARSRRKTRSTT